VKPLSVYYNEIDRYAAAWLRNLIHAGLIPAGDVDQRDIRDVRPDDLKGYRQCHFFAGIAGWAYALQLAGWPADREVWTGSCPCQPFSVAGKRKGFDDERHLWPVWRELIAERRPAIVFGEQVAGAAPWLRLVRGDLEALGYAVGAMPVEAASAGADHLRDRFWFVADCNEPGSQGRSALPERADQRATRSDSLADSDRSGIRNQSGRGDGSDGAGQGIGFDHSEAGIMGQPNVSGRHQGQQAAASMGHGRSAVAAGGDCDWIIGADGKARRVPQSQVCGVVDGLSEFVARGGSLDEVLQIVWSVADRDEGLQSAAVLLAAVLRQIEGIGADIAGRWQEACSEAFRCRNMLQVWERAQDRAASQGRRSTEQRPVQHRNTLPPLPQGYARCVWDVGAWAGTEEFMRRVWERVHGEGSPITRKDLLARLPERMGAALSDEAVASRVAKLRALGNAIDPRPAQAFITAFLEAEALSRPPMLEAAE
jgi:DNA (cytosine-5)-methyltransferase 1